MNLSLQTIARAEKLLALMRKNPTWGVWRSSSSKLFRIWAKECGLQYSLAYAAFHRCIVHLGLQGKVQKIGGNWHLVGEPIEEPEELGLCSEPCEHSVACGDGTADCAKCGKLFFGV